MNITRQSRRNKKLIAASCCIAIGTALIAVFKLTPDQLSDIASNIITGGDLD